VMVSGAGRRAWLWSRRRVLVAERLLRALTIALVLGVAALAFLVSFEAITAFAVATGAIPAGLGWCAPLLVDTFTAAATLVVWSRSLVGLGAGYARTLMAAATSVSLALNVAHAPDRLAARLVAALPPLALLAAVELVMSEARRALAHPSAPDRAGAASLPAATASTMVLTAPAGALTERGVAPATPASPTSGTVDTGDTRTRVRALLANEQAGGSRLTGKQVAATIGIKPRRAQELLRELRTQATASSASERRHPSPDAGAP
jgi:Protein of unknown function (DUF2637)